MRLKKIQEKRGISVMVGYVLLIVFAIIIGAIVFQWLRTYVPAQALECNNGVSVFLESAMFNETTSELNVTVRNNGRFSIAGYFIHAANNSGQELETIDLSNYLNESFGGRIFGNSVLFGPGGDNLVKPAGERINIFDVPSEIGKPLSIRITPVRFQEEDNRNRFISCGDSAVIQEVTDPASSGEEGDSEGGDGGDGGGGAVCGNGAIETGEQCDDNDTDSGDGCSSTCQTESGWTCFGEPSSCTFLIDQYFGFETGEQGWEDGGSDSKRFGNEGKAFDSKVFDNGTDGGDYSWNIDDDSESSYTQKNFDFTGYSQVTMNWWGYYRRFESHEPDCVELKIDGAKVGSWGEAPECDNTIIEDVWISHNIVLNNLSHTFDNSVTVRFEGEMDSDSDDFYLDGIELKGKA